RFRGREGRAPPWGGVRAGGNGGTRWRRRRKRHPRRGTHLAETRPRRGTAGRRGRRRPGRRRGPGGIRSGFRTAKKTEAIREKPCPEMSPESGTPAYRSARSTATQSRRSRTLQAVAREVEAREPREPVELGVELGDLAGPF